MSVLLVDAESRFTREVSTRLVEDGCEALCVHSGQRALESVSAEVPRALLLERDLPDMDGLELCQRLRRLESRPALVMFSAQAIAEDRVVGLDAGADDYLSKPLSVPELSARLQAILRRERLTGTPRAARLPGEPEPLQFGELVLDYGRHGFLVGGREARLSAREFALLELFMSRPGEILTNREILSSVWDPQARNLGVLRVYVGYVRAHARQRGA